MSLFKVSTGVTTRGLKLADGRNSFWQWDTDRELIALGIPEGSEVHYYREGMEEPLTLKVYKKDNDLLCKVPDELLQTDADFSAFVYITDEDGNYTVYEKGFSVKTRPKPSGYIYTETERYTVDKMVEEAIDEAKESGKFNGADGKDGKDGYTPRKGIDYYTEADKTEMVNAVLAALPNGDEVNY